MGSSVNETPKRHILAPVSVVWAITRENPSTRLTCSEFRKKGINKKKWLYFIHLPRSPPRADVHQIWHSCRGRRRYHLWQMFWWSVEGCRFCRGSKIAISHWLSQSPLTLGWHYRAARDILFTVYLLTRHRSYCLLAVDDVSAGGHAAAKEG